jgi:hypothetical protein
VIGAPQIVSDFLLLKRVVSQTSAETIWESVSADDTYLRKNGIDITVYQIHDLYRRS